MPKFECPKCGKPVTIPEGRTEPFWYCPTCGYRMTITYKIEKIDGDPISFLMKRAGMEVPDNGKNKTD